jgi:hypothetical protein
MVLVLLSSLFFPARVMPVYAYSAPQLFSPENFSETTINNYPPLGIPTLLWYPVEGAETYRVQISNNINFTSPTLLEVTTPHTTYTPVDTNDSLFVDGTWYWRVRVESPDTPGPYSEVWEFSKNWMTEDNAPLLNKPDDGAVLDFFNGDTFSWSHATGAANYLFQIAASPDSFSTPVYSKETLATAHQPLEKLPNGTYYWRVIPLDIGDHGGTISDVRSFRLAYGSVADFPTEVPTLLSPLDESDPNYIAPTFTPTFKWTAIPGAQTYQLQFTTDETCDFSGVSLISTPNTTYTPKEAFPNDARYCWHVRVKSGDSFSDWSQTWTFQKKWYITPKLLTPTNGFPYTIYPLYSWAPVPGAAYYEIEIRWIDQVLKRKTANPFYTPEKYLGTPYTPYVWWVTPYDNSDNAGKTSDVFSFNSYYTSTAPLLAYPLYYYTPNDYSGLATLNPVQDRAAPFPVFIWQRATTPHPYGGTFAPAYRIQVDTVPGFTSPDFEVDTENTSITPIQIDNFNPQMNTDYYWRVCPLNTIGGSCLIDEVSGDTWWSQIWKTRFDPLKALSPTPGAVPELLRPEQGQDIVEATPLLEWRQVAQADQYQVQIGHYPDDWSAPLVEEITLIPAYSPRTSLAQRYLGRLEFGTYFWRVRSRVNGNWGDWSSPWRFQISSQSEWRYTRSMGDSVNRLQIASDPSGDVGVNYDLTTLHAAQSLGDMYFGFPVTLQTTDMTYVLLMDIDHFEGSGADSLPADRPYEIQTHPGYQPEYAVFIDQIGGAVNESNTWVYKWNSISNAWDSPYRLSDLAGDLTYSGGYLEVKIPSTNIGMTEFTGSMSLILLSINITNGEIQDSTPTDRYAPGSGELTQFSSVSERLNLVTPPNNNGDIDPSTIPSMFPFLWDWPVGSDPTGGAEPPPYPATPYTGGKFEVHLDAAYSNMVAESHFESNAYYFAIPHTTVYDDLEGDTIYYWRVQPRYMLGSFERFGAWTNGWSFRREGFVPQNLQTSVTFATPTFSWDMVEGADSYDLQVATDNTFGTLVVNETNISQNSYTPGVTFANNDDYFWRVRVRGWGVSTPNDWSPAQSISLSIPSPTGLRPVNDSIVNAAPSFCWDHLIGLDDDNIPVLTAFKYRVEVSLDPSFQSIYDYAVTEQNCWTPTKGYDDAKYYWHVTMVDGNNRLGSYSEVKNFTKQYPLPTLTSPLPGTVPQYYLFTWLPVPGAGEYRIEISANPAFSPLFSGENTVNVVYTPRKAFEVGQEYYWRVRMIDEDSKPGPWSGGIMITGYKISLPIILR